MSILRLDSSLGGRMNEGRTVFAQLMDFAPKARFRRCVRRYKGDHRTRSFSCWDQCPHRGGCEPLAFRRSEGPCNLVACDTIGLERTRSAT